MLLTIETKQEEENYYQTNYELMFLILLRFTKVENAYTVLSA